MTLIAYFLVPAVSVVVTQLALSGSGDALLNAFAISIVAGCVGFLAWRRPSLATRQVLVRAVACTWGILAPVPFYAGKSLNDVAFAIAAIVAPFLVFEFALVVSFIIKRLRGGRASAAE